MQTRPADAGKKLQFVIDLLLTTFFLGLIFLMGVMTVMQDPQAFSDAFTKESRVKGYLADPENYSAWDMLEARVKSGDDYIAANCYKHGGLGYLNSGIQYCLGKRMVNTGGQQMVTLNTGHLYDLQNYVPMDDAAKNIQEMRAEAGDIPFLFVYEHPTLYSDEMMPEGYDVLDNAPRIAEEITTKLKEAGVPLLDSRDVLPSTFPELDAYLNYTDQHWKTRAAMHMAQAISEWLKESTGADFDPARLDIDQFDTTLYEKLFLGKYGQRIGTDWVDPDDIVTYAPKYETNIHRFTKYLGSETDVTGSFDEAVLKTQYLEPNKGKSYNTKAYFDYGLTENYEIFENPDGADATVLLLKDSYSAPVGAFLSLTAQRVASVDLRRDGESLRTWIDKVKPDAIVVSYSMQMLRDDNYEFQ